MSTNSFWTSVVLWPNLDSFYAKLMCCHCWQLLNPWFVFALSSLQQWFVLEQFCCAQALSWSVCDFFVADESAITRAEIGGGSIRSLPPVGGLFVCTMISPASIYLFLSKFITSRSSQTSASHCALLGATGKPSPWEGWTKVVLRCLDFRPTVQELLNIERFCQCKFNKTKTTIFGAIGVLESALWVKILQG